jgi:hypothetical protein
VLGVLGVLCAVVGLFLINGVSTEFPASSSAALATTSACRAGSGPGRF